jgi:hypothetical protein
MIRHIADMKRNSSNTLQSPLCGALNNWYIVIIYIKIANIEITELTLLKTTRAVGKSMKHSAVDIPLLTFLLP